MIQDEVVNFVTYEPSTGRILVSGSSQASVLELNTQGKVYLVTETMCSSDEYYVLDGELVARPGFNLTVSQDPFTVTDIPQGTEVIYPGGSLIVDDGFIEWTAIEPGEYPFTFRNFPYIEETHYAVIDSV